MRSRSHIVAVAMLGGILTNVGCVAAATAAEKEVVYWPLVSNATEYRRVAYPTEAGPLLVLADTAVVVEAVRTEVIFWPITREYLADLAGNPDFVEGTIEIIDESGKVRTPKPQPYVIWYPTGVGAGASELVRGDRALQLYNNYVARARASAEEMLAYDRLVAGGEAAVASWARAAADNPSHPPPPPKELTVPEPEPFQAYASEPRDAVVISLPAGEYTIRIRAQDGETVAGTERRLISFSARSKSVGYVLRPEDRWTRPLMTFDPAEAVYTTGKTDLFLQPVPVAEYSARQFTRLFRPQSVEVIDPSLTLWVPNERKVGEKGAAPYSLWKGRTKVETRDPSPYRVVQKLGLSRGYVIEDYTGQELAPLQPDFTAIRVARDAGITGIEPDEAVARHSAREIRLVEPVPEYLVFLPALLPIAFGLCLRRMRGTSRAGKRKSVTAV